MPFLAALLTAGAGAVNVASALTPELPARVAALLQLEPMTEIETAHALALPAGLALMAIARQLGRRRVRALHAAVALLVVLGLLDVVKGLDVEEALVSWSVAALLWRWRAAFTVKPQHHRIQDALLRAGFILGAAYTAAIVAVLAAGNSLLPAASAGAAPIRALELLTVSNTGLHAVHPYGWLPLGLGVLGVCAGSAAAAYIFAPLRPLLVPSTGDRRRAAHVVRAHGNDTLAAFKLRSDVHRRWSDDGQAFVAYRIEAGTLLLAGDPVGPAESIDHLLDQVIEDAHQQGLAFGVIGATDWFSELARGKGMRRVYIGDEALVPAGAMDLSGRRNKNLRNAVRRVARNGYTSELHEVKDLRPDDLAQMRAVNERWLGGETEFGFSMAHDVVVDDLIPETVATIARDETGTIRGFLVFAPVYGRPLASLAFMRRDHDTPNGLMEFLVVESARLLGQRGISEFSLNFAAFGRFLREPANVLERLAARIVSIADRWFQLERLLRFNAKFNPRWQPRYLIVGSYAQVPRVGIAAMAAEGQITLPGDRGAVGTAPVA